jgi:hypothetical protein
MKDFTSIQKAIKGLEKLGLRLELHKEDQSLVLGKVRFRIQPKPERFSSAMKDEGIYLTKSSKALRQSLQKKGISYFDFNGNLFLNSERHQVLIEETKRKPLVKARESQMQLSPTNLVSPNGLAFVDTILRLKNVELEKFQSTLQFCNHFDLYQPKVSQIMKKMGAKTLLDFKLKLKTIPFEWWLFAFEFPATKRKMTSFFGVSQNYYSLDDSLNALSTPELLLRLESKFLNEVAAGPIEVAKQLGEIIDDDFSVWISPLIFTKIKKDYKLVPGSKEGRRKWILAAPPVSLIKEELITHELNSIAKTKTNKLRVIWDLGFGDSRLREVRTDLLRRLLDEI